MDVAHTAGQLGSIKALQELLSSYFSADDIDTLLREPPARAPNELEDRFLLSESAVLTSGRLGDRTRCAAFCGSVRDSIEGLPLLSSHSQTYGRATCRCAAKTFVDSLGRVDVNISGKAYVMIGGQDDHTAGADNAPTDGAPFAHESLQKSSGDSDAVGSITIGVVSREQCLLACVQNLDCKRFTFPIGFSQGQCQLLTDVNLSGASAQRDARPVPSQQPVSIWTYDTRPYTDCWLAGSVMVGILSIAGVRDCVRVFIARYEKSARSSSKTQASKETSETTAQKAAVMGPEIESSGGARPIGVPAGKKTGNSIITPGYVFLFVCISALYGWVWSLGLKLCGYNSPLTYVPGVLSAVIVFCKDYQNRAPQPPSAAEGTEETSSPKDVQPKGAAAEPLDKTAALDAASLDQKHAKPTAKIYLTYQQTRAKHPAASTQAIHLTISEASLLITSVICISIACHLAFRGFASYALASIYLQCLAAVVVLGWPKLTLIGNEGLLGCTVCWETLVSLNEEWDAYLEAQRRRREDGEEYDMVEREEIEESE